MPERERAGSPLTPEYLRAKGGFISFPPAASDCSPSGSWTHRYDVWASRGIAEQGIELLGFIEMKRGAGRLENQFTLDVVQELTSDRNVMNRVTAQIRCKEDELASPVGWRLTSEHTVGDTPVSPPVDFSETVAVTPGRLTVTRDSKTFLRTVPPRFTSCWNLIEAVQRLPFGVRRPLRFSLLEGLERVKGEMGVLYDGTYSFELEGRGLTTHRFVQIGRGILPYEYLVDDMHRVLLVITFCKAYILKSAEDNRRNLRDG
jgi:hypothetical protein